MFDNFKFRSKGLYKKCLFVWKMSVSTRVPDNHLRKQKSSYFDSQVFMCQSHRFIRLSFSQMSTYLNLLRIPKQPYICQSYNYYVHFNWRRRSGGRGRDVHSVVGFPLWETGQPLWWQSAVTRSRPPSWKTGGKLAPTCSTRSRDPRCAFSGCSLVSEHGRILYDCQGFMNRRSRKN